MAAAIGIAALLVSVVSAVFTFLAWWSSNRSAAASERSAAAADRSAAAAESSDRREREPILSISLDHPVPAPADLVIYRVRNDGPQDLASVVIYRPQPPDRITYPLAVTGDTAGWAANEIALGPLAVTREAKFTFCCGSAVELPEFRVRIECKSGPDTWTLSRVLPPPRGEPISAEERGDREQILSSALVEIERNIEAVQSPHWYSVSLSDDALDDAHVLLRRHTPDWIGPIRDALFGLTDFAVWPSGAVALILETSLSTAAMSCSLG